MIRLRKNILLVALAIFACANNGPRPAFASTSNASRQDIAATGGGGVWNNIDVMRVDSDANLRLYNGSIVLGDNGVTPSATQTASPARGFYGLKVPFLNGASTTTSVGTVIIASVTTGSFLSTDSVGVGTFALLNATTTVLGVADGAYAYNTVGYMTIAGYALVHTTGTVFAGDLLVSTAAAQGYAISNNSASNGTVIGKAMQNSSANNASGVGNLILALIIQE